jgi:FMNH2-dependent dimethyl sulfone monooxygenase
MTGTTVTRPLLATDDFRLGIFSANCSSGLAVTRVPERWSGNWRDNLRLAQLADEAGIDFLLPIARWIGYGGDTNFHGGVLEPVSWAAGLLAAIKRITVFSTVHTAFNHPVVSAKQLVTNDHIGNGRAGVNIVAGWNKPEYEALGANLPQDHDSRYALAQEWWDIVHKIWTTDGSFDWHGRFWQLKNVEGMPKPVDGPIPVLNAGSSAQGRGFAARNANFAFTIAAGAHDGARIVRQITEQANTEFHRSLGVFTLGYVVCRATHDEAEEFHRYYGEEHADWDAVDNLMALQGLHAQSFTADMLRSFRGRFAAGHGSIPLVGTPDEVADGIESLARAGFAGMTVAFVDYTGELPYFVQEVIPRLEAKGIRLPR